MGKWHMLPYTYNFLKDRGALPDRFDGCVVRGSGRECAVMTELVLPGEESVPWCGCDREGAVCTRGGAEGGGRVKIPVNSRL